MANPKGEGLKLGFDGSLRLEFHGAKVTSDAGLLAYRDLDEALALFDSVPSVFDDSRTGRNIQHHLASLLRQSVYSRLAGYEDVNDGHRLSVDPTMRRITGKKIDKKNAASANTMGRFETRMLSVKDNLKALSEVNGQWVERALEKKGFLYAIRLPANQVLQEKIEHLLTRPVGRPLRKPVVLFADFSYQAASWDRPRRVIAKVEWHRGELFPRVGFIVINMSAQAPGVVHFYNGRGTVEQWIKEGKYALNWTRLSCQRFVPNQVRLGLFVLAYNLGNFLRRLVLPRSIKHWSLRSLLTKLIKIGAKVVWHSRIVTFQMAEVAVSQEIWAELLSRIDRLRWSTA